MQTVIIKATNQKAVVNSFQNEFGTIVYKLSDLTGQPIWNGTTRLFDKSQLIVK